MQNTLDKELISLLMCPDCFQGALTPSRSQDKLVCECCERHYPVLQGRPMLVPHDNELFRVQDYGQAPSTGTPKDKGRMSRFVPGASVNLSSSRVLRRLRQELNYIDDRAIVLVVGGGTQRELAR